MAQTQNNKNNKKFWDFVIAQNAPPELIIYGDIASELSWFGDEVTPKAFTQELSALGDVPEIVVRINSGGGDVFAANAIYTRLKDNPAKITVKIDGWAASAATIIAMAGDVIEIPSSGVFMVHDPKMGVLGYYSESEFVKLSEELKVIKQSIVNSYIDKTGKTADEISAIMTDETWYDGKQAVEAGFCDKIMFEDIQTIIENTTKIIVNNIPLDISRFPDMPISMLSRATSHEPCELSNIKNKKKEQNKMEVIDIKTVCDLRKVFPELSEEISTDATNLERKRIQDIEGVALAGYDNIVNAAKFENGSTAGDVAQAIVAAQKKQGANYLDNRNKDAKNSNAGTEGAGNAAEGTAGSGDDVEVNAAIDRLYPKTK